MSKIKTKPVKWTLQEDNQVRKLKRQGYTYDQIGKVLGRTGCSVKCRHNYLVPTPQKTFAPAMIVDGWKHPALVDTKLLPC